MIHSMLSSLVVPAAVVLIAWALVYLISWVMRVAGRLLFAVAGIAASLVLFQVLPPEASDLFMRGIRWLSEEGVDMAVAIVETVRNSVALATAP